MISLPRTPRNALAAASTTGRAQYIRVKCQARLALDWEGGPPLIYPGGEYSAQCAISLNGPHGLWREYLPTERWPLLVGGERFVEGLLPPSGGRGWRGVQAEADGTLVAFDTATGEVAWKMPLGTAPSCIVTGDVDGDGRPEAILGGQDGRLLVVRNGGDRPEAEATA